MNNNSNEEPTEEVQWISHRGYHKMHMEITIEAFDEAIQLGFTFQRRNRFTNYQKIKLSYVMIQQQND